MARAISRGLAASGLTVVSGLARGTDAEAHRAALGAGGRTIAVLGSGIDVLYPSEHKALALAISHQGAVVSEYLMGTKPDPENFPGRNRVISGLSLGTVVVEATERSGSLITASIAADQGREVFAVPGPVSDRTRGTHRLIREGAKLTQSAEDVLEEIAPHLSGVRSRARVEVTREESAVLGLLSAGHEHVDTVILRSGLPAPRVLQILLSLELKGLVEQLPGKFFVASGVDLQLIPAQE
jgi:DNA processing protein